MKKLLFSLAAFALTFSACGGGDDDPVDPTPKQEETPTITIDSSVTTNGLSFTNEAGEKSLTFTASDAWTLSVATTRSGASWCTPSQTSGGAGTVTVKFTVTANDTYDDRSVTITIRCGTVTISFTITQKAKEALLVTTTKYELGQEGGTIEVEVKANIDYQMEIAASAQGWITQASTRALTARTYKFNIAANEELAQREGEIHFKSGDKLETVKVYQSGATPVLVLGQKEITVSDAGETISVDIKSNVEYSVQMPSVDWITEAATRGMSSHTVKFTVQPNTDYDSRTAQIIFMEKNGSLKDTLTVTQAQKDAIVLVEKEMTVEAKGGALIVKLKANVDVTTTIAEDCKDWITLPATRGLVDKDVTLTIAENTSYDARTGNVTFSANGISETVKITQKPQTALLLEQKEITVSDKGETITVKLKSNIDFTIQMPSVDWITAANTRGLTDHTLQYTVKPNDTYDSRTAQIIFMEKNGSLKDTLTVTQVQKDAIVLAEKEMTVAAAGGTLTVKLKANVDVTTTIADDCKDWITLPATRGLVDKDVTLTIAENTSYDARTGSVTFSANGLSETVKIVQKGKWTEGPEITLTTAGTLDYNSIKDANSIKIYGNLNGTDIKTIRDWGASNNYRNSLDLSYAHIVEGGDAYYQSYQTSNNVVGDYMFGWCKIKNISLPKDIVSIGYRAFFFCDYMESVTIPESVTSIGEAAFDECSDLETIVLPESLTSIEKSTFANCKKLANINIPSNVTSIRESAFQGCIKLENINITENVTSIGNSAFYDCRSLKSFDIPSRVTSIGDAVFFNCRGLTSIKIPNGVTYIGNQAFISCAGLTNIEIPNSVTYIGNSAFRLCSSLTNIEIPNSVTKIEESTFRECEKLTSVKIPNSVTDIGNGAFESCRSLTSIEIPDNVTSIGSYAFKYCHNLTSINIPNGVTSIEEAVFYWCENLTSIEIPSSVTSIGYQAFSLCSSLTSIKIPNGVTSIGEYVFWYCGNLTSIEIPSSVTSIGWFAFHDCNNLTSIYCYIQEPFTVSSIVSDDNNCTLYVPQGTRSNYMDTSDWNKFKEIKEMDE